MLQTVSQTAAGSKENADTHFEDPCLASLAFGVSDLGGGEMVAGVPILGRGTGYLLATIFTSLAVLLRWLLPTALAGTPYLAFYPAVVAAAACGGFGPGLLATVGSFLCVDLLFDDSPGWINVGNPVVLGRLVIYFVGGLGISLVAELWRVTTARGRSQARKLDELVTVLDLANVLVRDWDDRITRWNTGCRRSYGFASEEALGRVSHALLRTRFPQPQETIRESLLHTGRWEGELVHTTADGREIVVASEWVLWRDAAGQPAAILESDTDITDRKRAEEALQRTAQELHRSNEDLGQFAYVASHDLQEPLRMVSGYLQLLRERYQGQLDDKADKYIAYAVDGAARMSQLIQDLLSYSRVNTRGEPLRSTNSEEAFEFAMKNLSAAIEQNGGAVTHDPLPVVHADGMQLAQLFQNLIGNALKFRDPERPHQVHVSATQSDGQWLFQVADNGIGFEQQYEEKMFLIFQRLHSRGKYPGTGIGLAICKRIVDRHGGRIWATGKLGQGATFSFTIPLRG